MKILAIVFQVNYLKCNKITIKLKQINFTQVIIVNQKQMNSSKHKQLKNSKRVKTENLGYSAFDDSVVFITITKIQKCLYDISKSNFDHLSASIKLLNKDINVISDDCKDKHKILLMMANVVAFESIHQKKYEDGIVVIKKKEIDFSEKTNPVIKLSLMLLKSLLLRYLDRQEESRNVMTTAIEDIDLRNFKVKSKSLDYKIVQSTIVCISIIADYFNQFQSHSEEFRQIYTEAYRISHKYLTQYHKLTETLYTICRKIPKKGNSQSPYKRKQTLNLKKHNSMAIDTNHSILKESKSERPSLSYSTQPKSINSYTESSSIRQGLKKPKPSRIKTLDTSINLQEQKQSCLAKLYRMDANDVKLKEKKIYKMPRLSTSLKIPSEDRESAVEMKDLQNISQIYLPKLQNKNQGTLNKRNGRLNAAEVLKYGSSLQKLKPNYFSKLSTKQHPNQASIKNSPKTSPAKEQPKSPVEKMNQSDHKTNNLQGKNQQTKIIVTPPTVVQPKQKPLPPVKEQQSCQLI